MIFYQSPLPDVLHGLIKYISTMLNYFIDSFVDAKVNPRVMVTKMVIRGNSQDVNQNNEQEHC